MNIISSGLLRGSRVMFLNWILGAIILVLIVVTSNEKAQSIMDSMEE